MTEVTSVTEVNLDMIGAAYFDQNRVCSYEKHNVCS